MKSASLKGFLVFAVALCVCFLAYFPLFVEADNALPMSGEDAYKNYYTLAYYLEHNPAGLHFEGMNYPFGEHLLYTDNQPLMAFLLKGVNAMVPIGAGLPLLMLLLIFTSCAAGAWALYKMVKDNGAPWWINALLCVALVLLSPQLQRISGHYSLAYAGLIPLVLYLDFRFCLRPTLARGSVLFLAVLALAFIHPYLLVMMTGLLLPSHLVQHFLQRSSKKAYFRSLLVTLLPVIVFQLVMLLTDSTDDRPANPYGFLVYKASIESVFLPIGLPYFSEITSRFVDVLHPSKEGFFYLGLASMLALVIVFFKRIQQRQLLRVESNAPFAQTFAYARCIGAIPVLILALGLPFAIKPLDEFLPMLGPLRQFRGIGRFVFTVYFAFGLNLLWLIGNYYKRWQTTKHWPPIAIAATLSFLLLFEAVNYRSELLDSKLQQMSSLELPELSLLASEYQCIYPMPYFHTGSELFRTQSNLTILRKSMELSLASGLPLNAVQMSRTSQAQTIQQFDLTTVVNDIPPLLSRYATDKPILLVHNENEVLTATEQKMVAKSRPIGAWNGLQLYSLDPTAWKTILVENIRAVETACQNDSGASSDRPLSMFSYSKEGPGTRVAGFMRLVRSAQNDLLALFPPDVLNTADSYVLSFWIDAAMPQSMNTQLLISEYAGDENLQYELFEVTDRIVMLEGQWVMIEIPFERKAAGSDLKMILYRDGDDVELHLGDIMLRHASDTVCFDIPRLNMNNRYFEPSLGENVPLQSN